MGNTGGALGHMPTHMYLPTHPHNANTCATHLYMGHIEIHSNTEMHTHNPTHGTFAYICSHVHEHAWHMCVHRIRGHIK